MYTPGLSLLHTPPLFLDILGTMKLACKTVLPVTVLVQQRPREAVCIYVCALPVYVWICAHGCAGMRLFVWLLLLFLWLLWWWRW